MNRWDWHPGILKPFYCVCLQFRAPFFLFGICVKHTHTHTHLHCSYPLQYKTMHIEYWPIFLHLPFAKVTWHPFCRSKEILENASSSLWPKHLTPWVVLIASGEGWCILKWSKHSWAFQGPLKQQKRVSCHHPMELNLL
jgi:hypothetical protein